MIDIQDVSLSENTPGILKNRSHQDKKLYTRVKHVICSSRSLLFIVFYCKPINIM